MSKKRKQSRKRIASGRSLYATVRVNPDGSICGRSTNRVSGKTVSVQSGVISRDSRIVASQIESETLLVDKHDRVSVGFRYSRKNSDRIAWLLRQAIRENLFPRVSFPDERDGWKFRSSGATGENIVRLHGSPDGIQSVIEYLRDHCRFLTAVYSVWVVDGKNPDYHLRSRKYDKRETPEDAQELMFRDARSQQREFLKTHGEYPEKDFIL